MRRLRRIALAEGRIGKLDGRRLGSPPSSVCATAPTGALAFLVLAASSAYRLDARVEIVSLAAAWSVFHPEGRTPSPAR